MGMKRAGLPVEQTPGAYRRNVGAIKIATVHDGTLSTSFDDVVGADPRLCEAAHRAAMRSVPPRFTCNIFVIDDEKELLLIDAGCGQTAPEAGRAPDGLKLLGIDPKHIDAVLITHIEIMLAG
jgi:glyoxylase-like metal-dependent hydrolase (beta-lactamase superfamily II)